MEGAAVMPVIAHADKREVPWRPGYRNFVLAGADEGLACVAGYSEIEPGAGAPLHVHHDVDEVFVVVAGAMEVRLGDETVLVEADHTVAIPAGTPHSFRVVGDQTMRMFTFMPRHHAIAERTTYLEGTVPAGAAAH
jgi:mannose-6-phosphate isomerase-like protein (cupin superfamily)